MGIVNEIGEGRNTIAGSVAPVIGNDQVKLLLMIKGRYLIIIAHHLTIPMEKKNPWPFVVTHVKAARDRNMIPKRYGDVEGISRA
jgi:hypothetical protein